MNTAVVIATKNSARTINECLSSLMPYHQQGVKWPFVKLENVDLLDLFDSSFRHDLNGVRGDIDCQDSDSPILKCQAMASSSRASVQNITPAKRYGRLLESGEVRRLSEENTRRQIARIPIVSVNHKCG